MRRLLAAVLAAGLLVAGCGGGGSAGEPAEVEPSTSTGPAYRGGTVLPLQPAPELGLRTIDGRRLRMAQMRGDVVLVTFVYANCPDICQLIVDNLRLVQERLGADGRRVRIVAVSVDPKGDTVPRVRRFLADHRMTGRMDYLVGTRAELEPVWRNWAVAAEESFDDPALVEHSGVVWGIDPQGRRTTYYPVSGVRAADIEHDVRLMLGR